MPYVGPQPKLGRNREVDDISSGFNGNATAFTLQVGGSNASPGTANDIYVSLGGVIQNPNNDFTIACSENSVQILELQKEGKQPMKSEEFLKGNKLKIGCIII